MQNIELEAGVVNPMRQPAARRAWIVSAGLAAGLVAGLAGGCKHAPQRTTWDESAGAGAGVAPGGASASPHGTMTSALRGTVAETMHSGGYTYARVTVGGKDLWAAGPETTLAVGASVDLSGGTLMTGFHSSTLDRTFDQIYFLSGWTGGAAASATAPSSAGMGASPHGQPAVAALAPGERIAPVDGGQTIEQLYAGKAGLAGKPVAIHGKVVKFNGGIMGKNWLHLQDGTGSTGTNDLIVTSQDTAKVGDIVVASGTITLDKDLGAGYRYDVLLEDATIRTP
ncbi:MAG TPA: hypothetical protein VHE35_30950 [Kofleriaceae bacterium]|nr:hypothetical protein [Kofleriaceae bacterium]